MKKVFIAILAVLYLGTSMGATIQLHFCMNKFAGWEIWHTNNSKCSKCGMEKKGHGGCCKDEFKQIKNTNDQKVSETFIPTARLLPVVARINFPDYTIYRPTVFSTEFPNSNAPPGIGSTPVHIINCVFLI
jgi:hypothetical protein